MLVYYANSLLWLIPVIIVLKGPRKPSINWLLARLCNTHAFWTLLISESFAQIIFRCAFFFEERSEARLNEWCRIQVKDRCSYANDKLCNLHRCGPAAGVEEALMLLNHDDDWNGGLSSCLHCSLRITERVPKRHKAKSIPMSPPFASLNSSFAVLQHLSDITKPDFRLFRAFAFAVLEWITKKKVDRTANTSPSLIDCKNNKNLIRIISSFNVPFFSRYVLSF